MIINIRELTAKAHNSYIAEPYPDWETEADSIQQPDIYNVSEAKVLGRPYFMELKLQSNKKVYMLPNEPLVSISLQKTIVETPTVGEERIGTVKEYICTEDFNIDIKGVCVGAKGSYPAKEVAIINELFSINEALDVKDNLFFSLFNIQKIILRNISFDEMMGKESVQKYTINAVSDQPFFAELTDRGKFIQK